jgi:hypothetical protein
MPSQDVLLVVERVLLPAVLVEGLEKVARQEFCVKGFSSLIRVRLVVVLGYVLVVLAVETAGTSLWLGSLMRPFIGESFNGAIKGEQQLLSVWR